MNKISVFRYNNNVDNKNTEAKLFEAKTGSQVLCLSPRVKYVEAVDVLSFSISKSKIKRRT